MKYAAVISRHLAFDQNFRFDEFLDICSCEWNNIFRNFWKRRQPPEVYPNFGKLLTGDFSSIQISVLESPKFWA